MTDADPMTPAQRQAVQKAWDIVTEHFEHVLMVVDFETEEDNERVNAHEGYWKGGALPAIGMCEYAKDRLLRSGKKYNEPE